MDEPRVSIIIPAYNEGKHIVPVLDRLFESVRLSCEVLVVVDDENDTTVPVVRDYGQAEPTIGKALVPEERGHDGRPDGQQAD